MSGSFLTGNVVFFFTILRAGIISGNSKFKARPRFGIILIIEGLLLITSSVILGLLGQELDGSVQKSFIYLLIYPGFGYLLVIPALASGMQNAVCTSYSGAVIRTTHMTVRIL